MENQVLSLELCKKFKELGIEIKTEFYWTGNFYTNNYKLEKWGGISESNYYPAPTLSELLEIVPAWIKVKGDNGGKFNLCKWLKADYSAYYTYDYIYFESRGSSPIEAVGKLIIYLKENNLI